MTALVRVPNGYEQIGNILLLSRVLAEAPVMSNQDELFTFLTQAFGERGLAIVRLPRGESPSLCPRCDREAARYVQGNDSSLLGVECV